MADIVLIQPPIEDYYLTAKRTMPYGLASIASVLKKEGFSVALIDALATSKSRIISPSAPMSALDPFFGRPDASPMALFHRYRHYGYSVAHVARRTAEEKPFLVGISSLFTPYARQTLEMATAVRQQLADCTLVVGGHHATTLPEAVMACDAVDMVLRGDGEAGMPALARALKARQPLDKVPGLVRRQADGGLDIAPPARVENLDRLPAPDRVLLDRPFYRRKGKRAVTICASRGCPLHCSYCAVNADSFHGFRRRSVSNVLAEIDAWCDNGPVGLVDFEDENLTMNRRWCMALLSGLQRRPKGLRPELRAMNGLYPPSLDTDLIGAMAAAGFYTLNLALASTDPDQLKRFGRADVCQAFDAALADAQSIGLTAVGYIIAGAPGQDPATSVNDLLYLAARRVLAGISIFYPAPGSRDYEHCRINGWLPADTDLYRSTALPVAPPTTPRQAVTLLRLGRLLNFAKSILDTGGRLPAAARMPGRMAAQLDRTAVGRAVLAGFLAEARIYGVTPDGRVYPHQVDALLCRQFLAGIRKLTLKGVCR